MATTRPSGAATTAASSPGPSSSGRGRSRAGPAIAVDQGELPERRRRVPLIAVSLACVAARSRDPVGSLARVPSAVRDATALYEEALPMVVQAYILIQTEVGKAAAVAREIAELKGVTQAEDVTGPYDVIVRAEARTSTSSASSVVAKVQGVDGITRTLTCPVVHL